MWRPPLWEYAPVVSRRPFVLALAVTCGSVACGAREEAPKQEFSGTPPPFVPQPPLSPAERVRLDADSVEEFIHYAAYKDDATHMRGELDRARGDLAVESAFLHYLEARWYLQDGEHQVGSEVNMLIVCLHLITHLRSTLSSEALLSRIEPLVLQTPSNKAVILLQMGAGDAAACIPDAEVRSRLATSCAIIRRGRWLARSRPNCANSGVSLVLGGRHEVTTFGALLLLGTWARPDVFTNVAVTL